MYTFSDLREIVSRLRAPDGCPWDREQTHESLKAAVVEEAAEVICGINILTDTGEKENLQEELGDLLLQIMMHAAIAEEEGLFSVDDVIDTVSRKMVRRHPHVFGCEHTENAEEALKLWEAVKKEEKAGKEWIEKEYLPTAFAESKELIDAAKKRKHMP